MLESSRVLGANTSAFTIGARAPNSSVLFAASASRSAPRPRGTGSSARVRRTTNTPPPSPTPLHRPATTHVVPPRAAVPSGQRSRTKPPHVPGTTSASTIPPLAGAGSSRRTVAALLPPAPRSLLQLPAHVASRSRPAAIPHRRPATPITPRAAPRGARCASRRAVPKTGTTTYHAPRNTNKSRPADNPTPNATVSTRIGRRNP